VRDRDEGDGRRAAVAVAALALGLVSGAAYVAQRIVERATAGDDGTVLLRTTVVSFYWRGSTALFWGGVAAISLWMLVRPRAGRLAPTDVASKLGAVVVPLAVVLFVLSLWLP
jgi:hypothetical protein